MFKIRCPGDKLKRPDVKRRGRLGILEYGKNEILGILFLPLFPGPDLILSMLFLRFLSIWFYSVPSSIWSSRILRSVGSTSQRPRRASIPTLRPSNVHLGNEEFQNNQRPHIHVYVHETMDSLMKFGLLQMERFVDCLRIRRRSNDFAFWGQLRQSF